MPKSIPLPGLGYLLRWPLPNRAPGAIDMRFLLTLILVMVLGLALDLERMRKIGLKDPSNFGDPFGLLEQGSP